MKTQDVIINKERLVKTIYNAKSAKCLQDDHNCELLLTFLLQGPMTFDDIKTSFKDVNAEKSDKTIYGYLNKLKKADLVMEAGKRIITYSESKIKTLTLYSRTAKVFYVAIELDEKQKKNRESHFEVLTKIACQILECSEVDKSCFRSFYDDFSKKKRIDIEKINEIDNPEILDLLASFDVRSTKYIIDTLCWILYIGDNPKVHENLRDCFKE